MQKRQHHAVEAIGDFGHGHMAALVDQFILGMGQQGFQYLNV
jgi:hypothetical protein